MNIHLITFSSSLHDAASVSKSHESMLTAIEKEFTIRLVDYREMDALTDSDFKLLFIATGGVENAVVQHFESLPHPLLILTDGLNNSLAASLEISAWVRSRGMKAEILHGEPPVIIEQIRTHYRNFVTQRNLRQQRVGVLGTPSSWLVASNVDYLLAKRRWGIEYMDIPLERIIDLFHTIGEKEVSEQSTQILQSALACREASFEELVKAVKLYRAIKQIAQEEQLDALTLSCFRLIKKLGTTGCLALALLNDEGVLAGCEGDLQSIFTMLALHKLIGRVGFMANPALINAKANEIVMAHCTVGTKQTERYIIRNHFESDSGVAIQGLLPAGDVTLVKCGGECLDEYFVSSGMLVENTNYLNCCRTQIRIKLNNPVSYFLNNPLGNHHIVIQGNYEKEINYFFLANGCRRVD